MPIRHQWDSVVRGYAPRFTAVNAGPYPEL